MYEKSTIADRAKAVIRLIISAVDRADASVLWTLGVVIGLANIAILLQSLWVPTSEVRIERNSITPERGTAYIAPLNFPHRFPLEVCDDRRCSDSSSLRLLENGRPLGPAHSVHADIRVNGGGRFSHWGNHLYFSSSDGSDPRSNGRKYTASATARISTTAIFAVLLTSIAFVVLCRRRLINGLATHRAALPGALAGIAAIGTAIILVNPPNRQPIDSDFFATVILHLFIAVLLTILQWTLGVGLARALLPKQISYAHIVLLGFPLSLAVLAALCVVALLVPNGLIVASALIIACLWPLYRWPMETAPSRDLLRRMPAILLLSCAFAFWLAVQWHGPTATLQGHPSGDLIFYASSVAAISSHPYPFPNLGNEGEYFGYFNQLIPALGAAIRRLIDIDGFLFVLMTAAVMSIAGAGIALHAYLTQGREVSFLSPEAFVLMLAILAAGRYPYWIAESPPVAHVVPLTIAVWFWISRRPESKMSSPIAVAMGLVGSLLSKVAAFATLGPLALLGIVQDLRRLPVWARAAVALLVLLCGGYALLMLGRYLVPSLLAEGLATESYVSIAIYGSPLTTAWPYVLRDVGCLTLAVMALVVMPWPYSLAASFGFLIALIFPYAMRINFVCASISLGLAEIDDPARKKRWIGGASAGLLLMLPAMVLTDPAGPLAGVVWLFIMAGLLWVIFRREGISLSKPASQLGRAVLPAVAVVLALVLFGESRGVLPTTRQFGAQNFTPDLRDIWQRVRELTPRDALVFTDQTGREPGLLGGWNTYAFNGERQVYLSSWYQSRELRNNPELRDKRLGINDLVLSGGMAPIELPTHQRYGSYFAVVNANRPVPIGWDRIYRNGLYAIWRIQ
ncbi:MAG: hypothetical protein K2Y71_29125 [Xanthobacteraceae bacterium]|nr:hypothetical protein [Xanthobacteraceae bacterium]